MGSKSAAPRTIRISASSGCASRSRCRESVGAARPRSRGLQHLRLRDARTREHRGPARLRLEIVRRKTGLLADLAHDVAGEINPRAGDIAQVRQAGREIDHARIRGMRAHDPEQERAVAAAQRAHAKAILDAAVREAPMAPGQQAGEIGFEIGAVEHRPSDGMVVQHQHPAVPKRRVRLPQRVEMSVDLGAPLGRKRPRPRRQGELEPLDRHDGDLGHASIVPFVTMTASPPMEADTSFPPAIAISSRIRLGRPIS